MYMYIPICYMFVCICLSIYLSTYLSIYPSIYLSIYLHVYTHTYIDIHIHMHECRTSRTCMYMHMYMYFNVMLVFSGYLLMYTCRDCNDHPTTSTTTLPSWKWGVTVRKSKLHPKPSPDHDQKPMLVGLIIWPTINIARMAGP